MHARRVVSRRGYTASRSLPFLSPGLGPAPEQIHLPRTRATARPRRPPSRQFHSRSTHGPAPAAESPPTGRPLLRELLFWPLLLRAAYSLIAYSQLATC